MSAADFSNILLLENAFASSLADNSSALLGLGV